MKTLTCPICGKTFEKHARNAVYCSKKCQNKGYHARRRARLRRATAELTDLVSATAPVSFLKLSKARTKPAGTSEVRWRMELRRRAMARRFGKKNMDMLPHPDIV